MNKAVVIFLLSIFLFNTMGYFIAFKIVQSEIEKDINSEINNNVKDYKLHRIIFENEKEIIWKKEGKEFEYKGEFYDIVKKVNKGSSIIFYCIHDKKDTKLANHLNKHINSNVITNKPEKERSGKDLSSKIIKLYFQENNISNENLRNYTVLIYAQHQLIYKSPYISFETPPPDLISPSVIS